MSALSVFTEAFGIKRSASAVFGMRRWQVIPKISPFPPPPPYFTQLEWFLPQGREHHLKHNFPNLS